jgi:hypothetical protein
LGDQTSSENKRPLECHHRTAIVPARAFIRFTDLRTMEQDDILTIVAACAVMLWSLIKNKMHDEEERRIEASGKGRLAPTKLGASMLQYVDDGRFCGIGADCHSS